MERREIEKEHYPVELFGITEIALGTQTDHGAHHPDAANVMILVEGIVGGDVQGYALRMAHVVAQVLTVGRAAHNLTAVD